MTSPPVPRLDRQELIDLFERWIKRDIVAEDVYNETVEIVKTFNGQWPDIYEDDPLNIPLEVITCLYDADRLLVTYKDAPALVAFLKTREGDEEKGLDVLNKHFSKERWLQRRQEIFDEFGPYSWYAINPDIPIRPIYSQ